MFYYVPCEISPKLVEMGKQCVKAFNVKERFFHFEFFRVKGSKKKSCYHWNQLPSAGWLNYWYVELRQRFRCVPWICQYCERKQILCRYSAPLERGLYFRKANQNYVNSIEAVCEKFAGNIISVQSVPGVFAKVMGEQGILARTETMEQMREIAQFAQAKQ